MLYLICAFTLYCTVGYGADISISPSEQTVSCNSGYNFDIILNTSGSKVVSSDVKFFLNGFSFDNVQSLSGFDQFVYVGTGIAQKGLDSGNVYHYLNFYQNSFSNFISGSSISLARIFVSPISGNYNGSIKFYDLGLNDEDSNIAVGINYALNDMPIQYRDNLDTTISGNYVFIGCDADPCELDGEVILHGDSIVKYKDSSVGCGGYCLSETRTCNNGVLTGTYINSSCSVESCGGGGGGGGVTLVRDDCPDGDASFSYYDGICGSHTSADFCAVDQSNYSSELKGAYIYSYMYGITTMCPIQDADIDGYLQRNHFAKMISEFAVNVLGEEPNIGKTGCNEYNDTYWDTEELQGFMTTACELELMGLNSDGITPAPSFNGGDYVTRAQFGTVFSRLLFGEKYNVADESDIYQQEGYWYKDHLAALKENLIMTKIDGDWPKMLELRGYVMLMMQRADNYGVFAGVIPALNGTNALFD